MIVAITGANGHIGNNLCRVFIKKGYSVKALINRNDYALKGLNLIKIKGSLSDIEALENLVKDTDYVIHTAAAISIGALNKEYLWKVNVEGTENLLKVCLKNPPKKLIHFSSIHALNTFSNSDEINENTPLANQNALLYDQSKAEAERKVLQAVSKGLDAVILNPTSVIGINDYEPSLLGQTIIKIAKNKLPFLIPGGYNWVDVRDVVDATLNALEKGRTGERYILSGEWKSLKEISIYIAGVAKNRKPVTVPVFLAYLALPFISIAAKLSGKNPLFTRNSLKIVNRKLPPINNNKAKKELSFNPRNAEQCFKDASKWFKENNFI